MTGEMIGMIGFGEAAQAFAAGIAAPLIAYDVKVLEPSSRQAKLDDLAAAGVEVAESSSEATSRATVLISLVSADEALEAATDTGNGLRPGSLYFDMNSVAPQTKRTAALAVERAGGRYVDVAVMSPVHPAGLHAPLLLAGPHASDAAGILSAIGFANVRSVGGSVGAASSIKMIRSVMVKGLEALCSECAFAAGAAGVLDEVVASLDASWPGTDWSARLDYNLDRMMVHGVRRAAEMEEAARTLTALGVDPIMTRGTIVRQRALGRLGMPPRPGLRNKLVAIEPFIVDSSRMEAP